MKKRKLILFDGERWFVERVTAITALSENVTVYTCDKTISGPHATLSDVPEVSELLDELRDMLNEQHEYDMKEAGERD